LLCTDPFEREACELKRVCAGVECALFALNEPGRVVPISCGIVGTCDEGTGLESLLLPDAHAVVIWEEAIRGKREFGGLRGRGCDVEYSPEYRCDYNVARHVSNTGQPASVSLLSRAHDSTLPPW